jgi:hypothetical protein
MFPFMDVVDKFCNIVSVEGSVLIDVSDWSYKAYADTHRWKNTIPSARGRCVRFHFLRGLKRRLAYSLICLT